MCMVNTCTYMHVTACYCTCMSLYMQVRSTLETLVSGKQEELIALQQELGQVKIACDRASREAQETRGLWEAEVRRCGVGVAPMSNTVVVQVKTKSRLGQELMNIQRTVTESRTESHDQVAAVSHPIMMLNGVNWYECQSQNNY